MLSVSNKSFMLNVNMLSVTNKAFMLSVDMPNANVLISHESLSCLVSLCRGS